jgi:hypothetical protein
MGDGLLDSLRNAWALCVQVADKFLPFDWFANALQVGDDRVQNLRTNDGPQFRINIFHDLLPSRRRITQGFQGQPAALGLSYRNLF